MQHRRCQLVKPVLKLGDATDIAGRHHRRAGLGNVRQFARAQLIGDRWLQQVIGPG